jgi:penicillin amidase
MIHLQNDDLSIPARTIVPLLRELSSSSAATEQTRRRLLDWNFVLDKDSVPAGIYEMFQRRLQANARTRFVPKEAPLGNLPMSRTIELLTAPDGRFGTDPIAGRDALLMKSLDEAVGELTKRFGADMSRWTLGAYHHAVIHHFMSRAMSADARAQFDVGDLPRGGDSYTITATGGGDNQTSGGSFKIIMDAADWDRSVGLNNPGQSGDVTSPHYRDLYELWARGKYFPIFFSRENVESVAERVWRMEPSAGQGIKP